MNLQEKLLKARENLNISIDSAEDIASEELVDNVDSPDLVKDVLMNPQGSIVDLEGAQDVIQLYQLVQDFEYIRETLRENAQNGRRVLRSVADDIMSSEEDMKASLIMSFAELNKAIADNIKLYISTYKTISETLRNIQIIQKEAGISNTVTKDVNIKPAVSTADIISRLRESKD